jgi:hypothetical protein
VTVLVVVLAAVTALVVNGMNAAVALGVVAGAARTAHAICDRLVAAVASPKG